jgi:putative ABC transport system permease protein
MYSLWLSWKHLIHRPANLFLNLLLLTLSTGLIVAVLLFNKMLSERLDRNLAGIDMVLGAKGSPLQLVLAGMYHVDVPTGNIPLASAAPFLREDHPLIGTAVPLSLGDSYKGYRIVGTDQRFLSLYDIAIDQGETFNQPLEILAGAQVARNLGLEIGSTFHSIHGLDDNEDLVHDDHQPFKVVGISKPTGTVADQLLLCSTATVWMVHDHDHAHEEGEDEQTHDADSEVDHSGHNHEEEGHVHGPDCDHDHSGHDHEEEGHVHGPECNHEPDQEASADEADLTGKEITSVLVKFKVRNHLTLNLPRTINENTDMQAASPAFELNRLYSMMGSGVALLRLLAWIILAVSGISIFISLYNSMKERRYELALMRTMGSTPGKLFKLILLEGFILALLGVVLGLIAAHSGIYFAGQFLEAEWKYTFDAFIFLKEELYVAAIILFLGVVAGLLPAWQARNIDIGETLSRG